MRQEQALRQSLLELSSLSLPGSLMKQILEYLFQRCVRSLGSNLLCLYLSVLGLQLVGHRYLQGYLMYYEWPNNVSGNISNKLYTKLNPAGLPEKQPTNK